MSKEVPIVKLDKLSYMSIPLKILANDNTEFSTCTGFIYVYNNEYYLITNRHCFTGRNNKTKKSISSDGFIVPAKVQIPFHKTKKPHITWERYNIDIIDFDNSKPYWLIHPKYKEDIDVIALKLNIPNDVILHPVNEQEYNNYNAEVSDDVFILGFPYNINGSGNFPIWKKGSIATEPTIDYNNLPQFLVDTASRTGMSGSPVIFKRTGIHGATKNGITNDTIIGEIQNFIGIYSGRYTGSTELEAQLGIIWKERVIREIIEGNYTQEYI